MAEDTNEGMDFDDAQVKEVTFRVMGSKYVLREPSAEAGAIRRSRLLAATDVEVGEDESGNPKIIPKRFNDSGEIELEYLANCVFPYECHDGVTMVLSDKHVSLAVVRKWPDRVVSKLLASLAEIAETSEESPDPTTSPTDEPTSGTAG